MSDNARANAVYEILDSAVIEVERLFSDQVPLNDLQIRSIVGQLSAMLFFLTGQKIDYPSKPSDPVLDRLDRIIELLTPREAKIEVGSYMGLPQYPTAYNGQLLDVPEIQNYDIPPSATQNYPPLIFNQLNEQDEP